MSEEIAATLLSVFIFIVSLVIMGICAGPIILAYILLFKAVL